MDIIFKTTDSIDFGGGFSSTDTCVHIEKMSLISDNSVMVVYYCFKDKAERDAAMALPSFDPNSSGCLIGSKLYTLTDEEMETVASTCKTKVKGEFITTEDYA